MEVLLLDTTQNEGEDNRLYHYVHATGTTHAAAAKTSSAWLELRGVLAAAVGATTSVCGEPLQCAYFQCGASFDGHAVREGGRAAGVINLYEVLFVLIFSACEVPGPVTQYYTQSSCDLTLSLFGYPDAKLAGWKRGPTNDDSELQERLDVFFTSVCETIGQDRESQAHLHFAFGGRVPVINYPLRVLAPVAALEPLLLDDATLRKVCSSFFALMDFLRLVHQWLLNGHRFSSRASYLSKNALEGYNVTMFELHDFKFARHGFYPNRHTFFMLERGDLQIVCLLEKNLDRDETLEEPTSVHELLPCVDGDVLRQLPQLAATDMGDYHALIRENRLQLAQQLFSLFLDRTALFQQTSKDETRDRAACSHGGSRNPDTPTWITPVPLDCDDPNTLFLHEKSCESGADISSEDTHIFPPFGEAMYLSADDDAGAQFKSRMIHQDAESYMVGGQRVWITANYYETFNVFAIFDEDFVSFEVIEQEMDRMCTFGGHTITPQSGS